MIIERLLFMQTEDNMVSFEKENGDTIIYPVALIPLVYKEGDIIKSIVHDDDFIEFIELDLEEMRARAERIKTRAARLRARAMRSTEEN